MAAPGVQHKCGHRGRHSAVWHDRIGRVMKREGEDGKDGPCRHNGAFDHSSASSRINAAMRTE